MQSYNPSVYGQTFALGGIGFSRVPRLKYPIRLQCTNVYPPSALPRSNLALSLLSPLTVFFLLSLPLPPFRHTPSSICPSLISRSR